VIRSINADAPAVFVYAPASAMVIHRRFTHAVIPPEGWWSGIWRWRRASGG
jgi:hypothetical protein